MHPSNCCAHWILPPTEHQSPGSDPRHPVMDDLRICRCRYCLQCSCSKVPTRSREVRHHPCSPLHHVGSGAFPDHKPEFRLLDGFLHRRGSEHRLPGPAQGHEVEAFPVRFPLYMVHYAPSLVSLPDLEISQGDDGDGLLPERLTIPANSGITDRFGRLELILDCRIPIQWKEEGSSQICRWKEELTSGLASNSSSTEHMYPSGFRLHIETG
mmetsp:Transcript_23471/g.35436  ORF Transcript_23471/g.35436 Transcript_23471/m.35436 type:complete len:212 (+) Transcript_23471:94-729(+)